MDQGAEIGRVGRVRRLRVMSVRRLVWYPTCDRKAWEWLLSRLLDMERDGKITIWLDHDEAGERFYDIREVKGS